MPAPFNYKNSDEGGIKVKRVGSEPVDQIKRAIKKGDRLSTPTRISDGSSGVFVDGGEIKVKTDGETTAIAEGSSVEVFGDLKVHGTVQRLGKQIEVWQNVVTTGDNLIELNANISGRSLKVPYSGIEINRGEEENAFFLYRESSERWTSVQNGKARAVALHGDRLSSFNQDLTTDDVPEGKKNKYSRPSKSTHNFWVSDKVTKTKGLDKKILPAFVSVGENEEKIVTKIRGSISSGTVGVSFLLNGEEKGKPVSVSGRSESEMNVLLEDGDEIGVEILEASGARNLSVSIEVTRYVN